MSKGKNEDRRVSSALDAGARLLGINITKVARWIGPVALTIWAIAWAVSHGDTEGALPKGVSPLELTRILLDWGGAPTGGVERLSAWISTRRDVLGLLSVLAVALGISGRHNIGVVLPLLLAIEAMGAVPAYLTLLLVTATIAVAAAIVIEVKIPGSGHLSVREKLPEAFTGWVRAVVLDVVLLPVFMALGVCRLLMDRYVRADDGLYTSADKLNDELSRQISNPSTKIGDLPAGEALRALAIIAAATRDEDRSSEILRFGRSLQRRIRPTP